MGNSRFHQHVIENLTKAQQATDLTSVRLLEGAKAYHTAVISIGYASFFGVWAFSREYLPDHLQVLTGTLIGVSVLLYVVFEMIQILYMQFIAIRNAKLLAQREIPKTIEEIERFSEDSRIRAERLQKEVRISSLSILVIWPFFFLGSVLTGFGAGIILLYNFICYLRGWSFWPTA